METSTDANLATNPKGRHGQLVWSQIDWRQVERTVQRLQHRIFMAKVQGDAKRVASLQRLLASSWSAKLLAVRQVAQQNSGRKTPGIDGVVSTTDRDRERLMQDGLCLKGYKPLPVRRVFIPKANGKLRPLGIPTLKDQSTAMPRETGPGTGMGSGVRAELLRVSSGPIRSRCRRCGQTWSGSRRCGPKRPGTEMPMDLGRRHQKLLRRN